MAALNTEDGNSGDAMTQNQTTIGELVLTPRIPEPHVAQPHSHTDTCQVMNATEILEPQLLPNEIQGIEIIDSACHDKDTPNDVCNSVQLQTQLASIEHGQISIMSPIQVNQVPKVCTMLQSSFLTGTPLPPQIAQQMATPVLDRAHLQSDFHYFNNTLRNELSPASIAIHGKSTISPLGRPATPLHESEGPQWPSENSAQSGILDHFTGTKRGVDGGFEQQPPIKRIHAKYEKASHQTRSRVAAPLHFDPEPHSSRSSTRHEPKILRNPYRGSLQHIQRQPSGLSEFLLSQQKAQHNAFIGMAQQQVRISSDYQHGLGGPLLTPLGSARKGPKTPQNLSIDHFRHPDTRQKVHFPVFDAEIGQISEEIIFEANAMHDLVRGNPAQKTSESHTGRAMRNFNKKLINESSNLYKPNEIAPLNGLGEAQPNPHTQISLYSPYEGTITMHNNNTHSKDSGQSVNSISQLPKTYDTGSTSHAVDQYQVGQTSHQVHISAQTHDSSLIARQSPPRKVFTRKKFSGFVDESDSDNNGECGGKEVRGDGNGHPKDAFLSNMMSRFTAFATGDSDGLSSSAEDPRVRKDFPKKFRDAAPKSYGQEQNFEPSPRSSQIRAQTRASSEVPHLTKYMRTAPIKRGRASNCGDVIDLTTPKHQPVSLSCPDVQMRPEITRQSKLNARRLERQEKKHAKNYHRQQAEAAQRILEREQLGKEQIARSEAARANAEVDYLFGDGQEITDVDSIDPETVLRERRIQKGIEEERRRMRDGLLARINANAETEIRKKMEEVNGMPLTDRNTKLRLASQIADETSGDTASKVAEVYAMTAEQQRNSYEALRKTERAKKAKQMADEEAKREELRIARNREAAKMKLERARAAKTAKEEQERQKALDAEERECQLWLAREENFNRNREHYWALKASKRVHHGHDPATQNHQNSEGNKNNQDNEQSLFVGNDEGDDGGSNGNGNNTESHPAISVLDVTNGDEEIMTGRQTKQNTAVAGWKPSARKSQGPLATRNALRGKRGTWVAARTADITSRTKVAIINEAADERIKEFEEMKKIFAAESSKANKSLATKMLQEMKVICKEQSKTNNILQQLMKSGVRNRNVVTPTAMVGAIREALLPRPDDEMSDPLQVLLRDDAHAVEARKKKIKVNQKNQRIRQQKKARTRFLEKVRKQATEKGETLTEEEMNDQVEELMVDYIKRQDEREKKSSAAQYELHTPTEEGQLAAFSSNRVQSPPVHSILDGDDDNNPETQARKQREAEMRSNIDRIRAQNIAARGRGHATQQYDDDSEVSEEDPEDDAVELISGKHAGNKGSNGDGAPETSANADSQNPDEVADNESNTSHDLEPELPPKDFPYLHKKSDLVRIYPVMQVTSNKGVNSEPVMVRTFTDKDAANKRAHVVLVKMASAIDGGCLHLTYSRNKDGFFSGHITLDEEEDIQSMIYVTMAYKYANEFVNFDKAKLKPRIPPISYIIFQSIAREEHVPSIIMNDSGEEVEVTVPMNSDNIEIYKIFATSDLANQRAAEHFLELVKPLDNDDIEILESYTNETCKSVRDLLHSIELKEDGLEYFDVTAELAPSRLIRVWVEPRDVEGPLN